MTRSFWAGLSNLLPKIQYIGSFLSGCILHMHKKVTEANAFICHV